MGQLALGRESKVIELVLGALGIGPKVQIEKPQALDGGHGGGVCVSWGQGEGNKRRELGPVTGSLAMKVHTLEISWHAKEPILSADICGDRLATAGADTDVKVLHHTRPGPFADRLW